jgi:regulator of sigma E protease
MSVAMIGQFILSLSLLIVLHECGHFFPARWFKTRVEKFYLFFDPYFSLFKKKIGDTEYGIGWLPFGGYVKISGMIDESMDKEQMNQPPQPWEFRSKKAWQRLIIMLGGVTVNFVLGILIFIGLKWYYGEDYLPNETLKYGIYADSTAQSIGLKTGDKILSIGGNPVTEFDPKGFFESVVFNGVKNLEVERNGQRTMITIPEDGVAIITKAASKQKRLMSLPDPFLVDSILEKLDDASYKGGLLSGCNTPKVASPAFVGGLKKGDKILSLNDIATPFYAGFSETALNLKGQNIKFSVLRGADTLSLNIKSDANGKFGFQMSADTNAIDYRKLYKTRNFTFAESIPLGTNEAWETLTGQIKAFGKIFKGEIKAKDSVGSFLTIGKQFGLYWDWERFWTLTGTLSIILAFMNLLPVPALDGGYVMFLLWEVITGRRVSDAFMEKAVTIGFFLLLTLIVSTLYIDFARVFGW